MRIFPFIFSVIITTGLIAVLDSKIGSNPPVGKLLSPSHGLWKNAEPSDFSFSADIITPQLQDEVTVSLDERLVPHVFAKNDHDAYLVQGYLHAKFRLWQMDFEAYAAAGRLCEILGEKIGDNSVLDAHDRKFRRLGMVYAAENALRAINADPKSKEAIDAYTAGVNAYIHSLHPEDFPIEYKLLGYVPEAWTPLKSALIFKYMSYDLTTDFDDFEYTNISRQLRLPIFGQLYPLQGDSTSPIVPKGTLFTATRPLPIRPASDSLFVNDTNKIAITTTNRDPDIGSNNWVVSGSRTASGRPILCNDPHLGLNLPSLWYEIQIHTPAYNVYGVSLSGVPTVIIGFNDSIAWGMTNASRDVMDFYEIKFKDSTMSEYWYDSAWKKTEWRTEVIHIKGQADFADKIAMTVWGPVMYDKNYTSALKDGKAYAVKWTAHEPVSDVKACINLNRANNYQQFLDAIKRFGNPAQNFVFASKRNNIALWQIGALPAKWKSQGDFIMPGWDSSYQWQGYIPFDDKIHELNPERGYVSSANQLPADTSYPYYLGGFYDYYRGIIINRMLQLDSMVTIADMQQMQTSTYDIFAETALPVMFKNVNEIELTANAKKLLGILKQWNLKADPNETGKTIFEYWWNNFRDTVWRDDIKTGNQYKVPVPADQTLLEGILRNSIYQFVDDKETPQVETLQTMLTASLNKAASTIGEDLPSWTGYQDTRLTHLLKIPAFTINNLNVGGGRKIINCIKRDHGPSWRMIVQMTDETEAYGVYPGGQHGNPGSKYYEQFVTTWAAGKYYRLLVMKKPETRSNKPGWTLHFKPA
jgi:penicillin amidase